MGSLHAVARTCLAHVCGLRDCVTNPQEESVVIDGILSNLCVPKRRRRGDYVAVSISTV